MTTIHINILTLLPCSTSAPQNTENVAIHSTQNDLPFVVANVAVPMIHHTPPQMPLTHCQVIPVISPVPPQVPPPPHPTIARSPGAQNIAGSLMTAFFNSDEEMTLFNSYRSQRDEKKILKLIQKTIQQNPTKYDILLNSLLKDFPDTGYPITLLDLLIALQLSNPMPMLLKGAALIKQHHYLEGLSQIKEGFVKRPTFETIEWFLPLMNKLQNSDFQLRSDLMITIPESDQALLHGIFLSAKKNFDRANRCLQDAFTDISTSPLARMLQLRNEWVNHSSRPVLPSKSSEEAVDLLNGFAQGNHQTSSYG